MPAPDGTQIPLIQLAEIHYVRGPQVIKSEDTFLIGYVLFDKKPGYAEVDVVGRPSAICQDKIAAGEFVLPAGVSYTFAGSYENQVRSEKRLMIVLPLALLVIFLILYFQFRIRGHHAPGLLRDLRGLVRRLPPDLALRPALVPGLLRLRDVRCATCSRSIRST